MLSSYVGKRLYFPQARKFSSSSKPPTAILMLNMGGPATPPETGPFLRRLFTDPEIIALGPLQNSLGRFISARRTPRIQKQYESIGGSPILKWTEIQGKAMVQRLDKLSPETAPHKYYVTFRYADPLTPDVIQQMSKDQVKRAIAFSQYPQFSCTTTGSSLNHLWRELHRAGLENAFQWSVIDRWPTHPLFIQSVINRINLGLESMNKKIGLSTVPASELDRTVIVFSAHSLPMRVVNRGDPYPQEVAATVQAVMEKLNASCIPHGYSYKYLLAWQSQVGPLPWLGPQTGDVLKGLGSQGHKRVLVVPIAFMSDHVETLFEIDQEYAHVAKQAGITHFHRAPAMNDEPLIFDALAQIVADHIAKQQVCTSQYSINCALCTNPMCRSILNPITPYQKLRDRPASA